MSDYFTPDERYALVICNSQYSDVRQKEHFGGFADLEEVKQDLVNVKAGLRRNGFGAFNIHAEEDCDYETFKSYMDGYRVKLITNKER